MQIVDISKGRLAWWFVGDEVRPMSGFHLPDLIGVLSERYSFGRLPNINKPADDGSLTFELGKFVIATDQINIAQLVIRSDVLVIEVDSSTDDADDVLADIIETVSTIGFRDPQTEPTLIYQSILVADLDGSINTLINGFDEISKLISGFNAIETPVQINSIKLGGDPLDLSGLMVQVNPTTFTIERRANVPYNDNRFYCAAYMRTPDHIEVLRAIERILAA